MILGDCSIALDATNINPLKPFDALNNVHDKIKFTMKQHKRKILRSKFFEQKYFRKILILRNAFHLAFVILNNAKMIYLLHLLDEFEPQQKTAKLEIDVQINFKKFYIYKNIHKTKKLFQEAIPKAAGKIY